MQRALLTFSVSLALVGCGASGTTVPPVAAAATASSVPNLLGSIDGAPISQSDLDPDMRAKIDDLSNETQQRRLHLLWVGLEDVVAKRLLTKEARKRGVAVEALREQEILKKVAAPTDEEVQQFYDQNADRIGVDFRTAAPQIRSELAAERARALEHAFVDRLRDRVQVKYNLPVPELPRSKIEAGPGPSWGAKDAKVTIVEFSDFQCPYCARETVIINKLRDLYPKDLRIEFRSFPLVQHSAARGAAEAAVCAHEQGKFWEYHDVLFANSRALGLDDLKRYASDVNLDLNAFASCLASDRPKNAVETSMALGQKLGVEGTPAVYVNGIKLIGLLPLPIMQALIDHELGRP
jgi:protein-disulfide isomerase